MSLTMGEAQIYADVKTSKGGFTIFLNHVGAPKAVANFIRLAEGTCGWVDATTGQVKREPYYNGTFFHQVSAGSVSRAGSRTGDGTDGPGYHFQDEFTGGVHTRPYVVSMDNSGPNTNGARFLITAAAQPQLDYVNSVFGEVILYDEPGAGTSRLVCNAINAEPVDSDGKPLTDVVIGSITIRREGQAAKAFNEHAQGLPEVWAPKMVIDHAGSQVKLQLLQPAASLTRCRYSFDLISWKAGPEHYLDAGDSPRLGMDVSAIASAEDRLFFNMSQLLYDGTQALWPHQLTGRTLRLVLPELVAQWGTTTDFTFTSENGGTMANAGGSGTFAINYSSRDWLGSQVSIEPSMKYAYNDVPHDVRCRLRLSRDTDYPLYFQGRHSGVIDLERNGVIKAILPTRSTMTLTR